MRSISSFEQFNEARVINTKYDKINKEASLSDDEVIRVYHGFSSERDAYAASKYGISGKVRAKRSYSYEAGNNPNGVFVTIDFDIAKRFATAGYIMEFHTKVSDLEAPVWAGGGSYFVAGQYAKTFDKPEDREAQRLANRAYAIANSKPNIATSDRPELADTLFDNPEKQALFTGDLNPNMIKAFWVNDKLVQQRLLGGKFVRLTTIDFNKLYVAPNIGKHLSNRDSSNDLITKKHMAFQPNDDYSEEALISKYGKDNVIEYINNLLARSKSGDYNAKNELSRFMYPKQYNQAIAKTGL